MGWKKTVGIVLIVLGVLLVVLSVLADRIGIGSAAGFGYKQIIGVIVGVIAGIRGLFLLKK